MSTPGVLRPADDSDVVMSCRVRLARNVAGMPFVGRATHPQRREALGINAYDTLLEWFLHVSGDV